MRTACGIGVVVLAAIATPARADSRFDARGDEIVALVRDNFVDAARAEAWAAKHRGYAATVRDEARFAARTEGDVEVADALEYAQGRDPQLERALAIAAHDARARAAPKKQK